MVRIFVINLKVVSSLLWSFPPLFMLLAVVQPSTEELNLLNTSF